jgi:hypothetical protein
MLALLLSGVLSEKLNLYLPRDPLLAAFAIICSQSTHLITLLTPELYIKRVLLCNFMNAIAVIGKFLLTYFFPIYIICKKVWH